MTRMFAFGLCVFALSGCAVSGIARVDGAGSPVVSMRGLQSVDLPNELDPRGYAADMAKANACLKKTGTTANSGGAGCRRAPESSLEIRTNLLRSFGLAPTTRDRKGDGQSEALALAFAAFYDPAYTSSAEDRRNRLQHRLILASNANCEIFAETLYGTQASLNFGFGSLATSLAGAGSIVKDVNNARLLSGLSGISSGIRAEMNEDFFRKQWVEAVTKAIDTERDRLAADMQKSRGSSIRDYPVEAAVADAVHYNSACSLIAGLKQVNQAVLIADDPAGMKAFRETYERAGFDARFSISATSSAEASNRLLAPHNAQAAAARLEIATEVARLRSLATEHKAKIDELDSIPDKKAPGKQSIDAIFARYYADADNKDTLSSGLISQLDGLAKEYDDLTKQLAGAADPAKREQVLQLMRANDAQAAAILRSAKDLSASLEGQMDTIVSQLMSENAKAAQKT